jgi:hypothetical protein
MSSNAFAFPLLLFMLGSSAGAWADGEIYSCTDAKGNRHTSDRLIPECQDREHKVLGPDGSVRKVLPPMPTQAEQAEKKAREARAAEDAAVKAEAVRRDMAILKRFPTRGAHDAARRAALEIPMAAIKQGEARLAKLNEQKSAISAEAGGHSGKSLPPELQHKVSSNTAAIRAQQEFLQVQQAEVDRLNALYDKELAMLKRLWETYPPEASAARGGAATTSR